jgi:hypothetical protein
MTPAQVRENVVAALLAQLQPLGFTRHDRFLRRQRVLFAGDWPAVAAVGERGHGPINVTVNIGVHCAPLHRLLGELSGGKYDANVATFAVNIGYLRRTRGYAQWPFARMGANDERMNELVLEVVAIGLPFYESFDGAASVRRGCEAYGLAEYNRLRLPALDFLGGNHEAARDALLRERTALAGRIDAAAEHFRAAAEVLLGRIAAAG